MGLACTCQPVAPPYPALTEQHKEFSRMMLFKHARTPPVPAGTLGLVQQAAGARALVRPPQGWSSRPSSLLLPASSLLRAGTLFSPPRVEGQGVTQQPCPLLLPGSVGVQPWGGQAPPSVQSIADPRGAWRLHSRRVLEMGPPPLPSPLPVVSGRPFLPP